MNKRIFATGVIVAALCAPFITSAISIQELQTQVQNLVQKLQTATGSGVAVSGSTDPASGIAYSSPRMCGLLKRSLAQGSSGEDVRSLQEFLASEGYLNASATGYFGGQTFIAVKKWQAENGVSSIGRVGPATREAFMRRCGNQYGFRVTPHSGQAPLTVTAYANVGGFTMNRYYIDFGDGSMREQIMCNAPADACVSPGSVSHTYTTQGTYTVALVLTNPGGCPGTTDPRCLGLPAEERVLAKELVRVGDMGGGNNGELGAYPQTGQAPLNVSFTFAPQNDNVSQYWIDYGDGTGGIMQPQTIYCVRAPCIAPQVASHTYTKAGTYTAEVTPYVACMHPSEPGMPVCLMYAMPLARAVITVTGNPSHGGAPVISSFSGPVTLAVNEIGTWRITASDPENGSLQYSILWGDEWTNAESSNRGLAPSASIQQQTSFTHSYARPGTYNVQLTVTDSEGKQARATASVQVSQTACTKEYRPVCGRPMGCVNTCPPGMYCAAVCQLPQPVTYGNRCELNNANATYLHDGACTGQETF